ncbi:MAG: glycosyltransferase family 39 protein [Acidimicrobiales bacterium]
MVFLLILVVHGISPSAQVTDSRLSVLTAYDLLHNASLDLSDLPDHATTKFSPADYDLVRVNGHDLPFFPYAPMALLVPVVGIAEVVGVDPLGLRVNDPNETWKLEIPAASLVVAGTGVVVALIAFAVSVGTLATRRRTALLAALFFAFGTAAWSTASRAFWQHTPAMLFVALAILQLARGRQAPRSYALMGGFVAIGFTMRPSVAALAAVLGIWLLVSDRRRFATFAFGSGAVLVPFAAINLLTYGGFLPPYFEPDRLGTEVTLSFFDALAAHAVSPSRGVLVYTPLLLLIPVSLRLARRADADMTIYNLATAAVAVHWVVVASYGSTGGSSYGSRFFTETTPLLVLLLVPLLNELVAGRLQRGLQVAVVALAAVSIVVAGIGATLRAGFCWSATPEFIEDNPHRVWDLADPQFLRPMRDLVDGESARSIVIGACRPAADESSAPRGS